MNLHEMEMTRHEMNAMKRLSRWCKRELNQQDGIVPLEVHGALVQLKRGLDEIIALANEGELKVK